MQHSNVGDLKSSCSRLNSSATGTAAVARGFTLKNESTHRWLQLRWKLDTSRKKNVFSSTDIGEELRASRRNRTFPHSASSANVRLLCSFRGANIVASRLRQKRGTRKITQVFAMYWSNLNAH